MSPSTPMVHFCECSLVNRIFDVKRCFCTCADVSKSSPKYHDHNFDPTFFVVVCLNNCDNQSSQL